MLGPLVLSLAAAATAQSTPAFIPLNYAYIGYPKVTASLHFGTPAQETVEAVMDMGSADFWVYGPNASVHWGSPYLGEEGPCVLTPEPFYQPNTSSTAEGPDVKSRGFAYGGNGKTLKSPYSYNDTVSFGDNTAVFSETTFAIVNYTIIKVLATQCTTVDYDPSILGLSRYVPTGAGPSFRQGLLDSGTIESSTMSMWFDAPPSAANATFHGTALFGAIPAGKYSGDLVEVAANHDEDSSTGYYVSTPVFSAGLETDPSSTRPIEMYDSTTTRCLIDSGSGQDYLPISRDDLLNATGLIYWENYITYNGSCDSMPADFGMTLTFAGAQNGSEISIKIPFKNYARGNTDWIGDSTKCGLSMRPSTVGSCTLGSPFFSSAFVAVNDEFDQIGLAQGGVSSGAADGFDGLGEVKVIAKGQGLF